VADCTDERILHRLERTFRDGVCLPLAYPTGGPFPSLYLLHGRGHGDTATTWRRGTGGDSDHVVRDLIQAGDLRPTIVITPYLHLPGLGQHDRTLVGAYFACLIREVEQRYPVNGVRAIAGVSRGARQAIEVATDLPVRGLGFHSVGTFSGEATNAIPAGPLQLFYHQCAREDRLILQNEPYAAQCRRQGNLHVEAQFPRYRMLPAAATAEVCIRNNGHCWPFWRDCLREYLPRLIRSGW
jgi:enterochelin esterase-like enzyme